MWHVQGMQPYVGRDAGLRTASEQDGKRAARLAQLHFQRFDRLALVEYGAALLAQLQRGGRAVVVAGLHDTQDALGDVEVPARDVDALLQREHLEPGGGHARTHRQAGGIVVMAGGDQAGAAGIGPGGDAAPEIEFVAGAEAQVGGAGLPAVDVACAAAAAQAQRRKERGAGLAQRKLGLHDALGLDAQVGGGGHRLGNERIQLGSTEVMPPVGGDSVAAFCSALRPCARYGERRAGDRFGDRATGREQGGNEEKKAASGGLHGGANGVGRRLACGVEAGVRKAARVHSEARATTGSRRAALRAGR